MDLKDIVKITLFGVIGFVISIVTGLATSALGIYGPFIHTSIGSLLTAPIFIIMYKKIHKKSCIFLYYLISGLAYSVMGFWPMLIIMLLSGIVGEIIAGTKNNYDDDNEYKRIGLAFVIAEAIYSLHGFLFILVLGTQGLVNQFPKMFTLEKAQWMRNFFFNPRNFLIIMCIQIIASILGVLLAKYIHKKFFAKNIKNGSILD